MRKKSFDDFYGEDKQVTTKTVVLDPGLGRTVSLGIYPNAALEPDFTISLDPDKENQLGIALAHVDLPDGEQYMLLYQFHNFGDSSCSVTLQRSEDS